MLTRRRLYACLLNALLAYCLFVPLPAGISDRPKVQLAEYCARLIYFYPTNFLSFFGSRWQLMWARVTLKTLIGVTNPILPWDPDMTIEESNFAGVPVRIYLPTVRKSSGAVVFVHGGGFVLLSVAAYEGVAREIARKTGMATFSLEYRLAPEHKFPAAIEDVQNATTHLMAVAWRQYGVDPAKVAIVGDSAGGNLATVIAQKLRSRLDLPRLKAQVLIYPVLQFSDFRSPSYQLHSTYDRSALMDPLSIARWLSAYLGVDVGAKLPDILANRHVSGLPHLPDLSHSRLPAVWHNSSSYAAPTPAAVDADLAGLLGPFLRDPNFAPLMQPDLTAMPDSFVATCQFDVLRDEGYQYAARLRRDGAKVTYRHYADGFHTALNFHNELAVGRRLLADAVAFISATLA